MTSLPHPGWLAFVLLSLAAFRVYRLIARDTITEPLRASVTYPDDATVELGEKPSDAGEEVDPVRARAHAQLVRIGADPRLAGLKVIGDDEQPKTWRVYLSTLLRCPWCAGFYVAVAWWAAWAQWPHPVLFAAVPWAISGVVALLAKNLDA